MDAPSDCIGYVSNAPALFAVYAPFSPTSRLDDAALLQYLRFTNNNINNNSNNNALQLMMRRTRRLLHALASQQG